jgi:hypothetical protein
VLALQNPNSDTNAAPAASYREVSGGQGMAKPYASLDQDVLREHPMVKELLAELQAIDEKARLEIRFDELITHISHIEV